jgi:hypothetical protein
VTPAELTQIVREVHLNDLVDAVGETAEVTQRESELFSPEWYLRECQRAEREAFQRSDLRHVYDDSSFTITLQTGVSGYALDRRVLRIGEALMSSRRLGFQTKERLEHWNPYWREMAHGQPVVFYVENRTIRFVPTPSATWNNEAVTLGVYRMPLSPPQWNDEFEWPYEHEDLAHWVAHRAFLVPNTTLRLDDARGADNMAEYHFQAFNAAFGEPLSHRARLDLLQNPSSISFVPAREVPRAGYGTNFLTED